MVAMPSLHFFRWTEQLKDSGFEVYWFDIVDGGQKVERLHWVHQIVGWKRRWEYPGRHFIKKHSPFLYRIFQKFNERTTANFFEQKLKKIKPDIVHSFALQISCLPILSVMLKYPDLKWIYSSWGSDIYFYHKLSISKIEIISVLERVSFLITDCNRDYAIAKKHNFKGEFLGVYPGNGGILFLYEPNKLLIPNERDIVLIKGYNNNIGKGIQIIKAIDEKIVELLQKYNLVIFGADKEVCNYINNTLIFKSLNITLYTIEQPLSNNNLLELMNKSYLYIANSLSDGIPNTLLEAMGMGCFPIQSNPGNVTSEVIKNGINGLLIENPMNIEEINKHICLALSNNVLIEESFKINIELIRERCDRNRLKQPILSLYEELL